MKPKSKSQKNNRRQNVLLIVGALLLLVLIVGVGALAFQNYQNGRPSKILSDAIENSDSLISSQDGFRRIKIEFAPAKPGTSISVAIDTDGMLKDGIYKGSAQIDLAIFRVPLELKGDVVGADGYYYLRLNDIESSIKKAEINNAEFKLYSSYLRELSGSLEDKWIKISSDRSDSCSMSNFDSSSDMQAQLINQFIQHKSNNLDFIKLADEKVNNQDSYHLSSSVSSGGMMGMMGAKCSELDSSKVQKIDVWVSKKNRIFTKVSATTKSGIYSIEPVESKRDSSAEKLLVPTEFTTVEDVKKFTEQIIGTPKN